MLHHNWVVKGGFRVCQEACCETWSVKMGFAPLYKREISLGPSSDSDQEMHGHARGWVMTSTTLI